MNVFGFKYLTPIEGESVEINKNSTYSVIIKHYDANGIVSIRPVITEFMSKTAEEFIEEFNKQLNA